MKKVVKKIEIKEIEISNLTNNSIVGIVWQEENRKSIVIKSQKGYTALDNRLNIESNWCEDSIKKYVEEALKAPYGATEVFVFDSLEEIFNWMVK